MDKIITQNEYIKLLKEEQELLISYSSVHNNTEHIPTDNTIKNILDFSKAYSCRKSSSEGYIEMVLN